MLWHLEPLLWHLEPLLWHLEPLLWHLEPMLRRLEPMLWHLEPVLWLYRNHFSNAYWRKKTCGFCGFWLKKCWNIYSKNLYVFISLIILWYIQQTKHTFVFPPSSLFNKFSGNVDIYILSCVFQFLMEEVGITRSNDQEVHEQYVFDVTTLFQTQGLCLHSLGFGFRKAHC